MDLIVSNPLFLRLLPLAALPVLFHLFARVRRNTLTFSTFMFFRRIDPLLSARRTLRQWLLLVLRTLVLLLLLLALAGLRAAGPGPRGKTACILVIDNSGSMSAPGADAAAKQLTAAAAAEAAAAGLAGGDAAALVLLVDDPAAPLPSGWTSDPEAVRTALRRLPPTEASGAPGRALGRALALAAEAPAARREILVFSDLQAAEWAKPPAAPWQVPPGASLNFVRIPSRTRSGPNVSVTAAARPDIRRIAGRRGQAGVRLRNTSGFDADIRLHSEDDQGETVVRRVSLPAGKETTAAVELNATAPGQHWKTFWIEGDDFLSDNRAALALEFSARMPVLFLGAPGDFGTLPTALSPCGDGALSGLFPVFAAPADGAAALGTNPPALVVLTWSALARNALPPDAWQALERYVAGGGNCLLAPAAADPAPAAAPGWIGLAAEDARAEPAGARVMIVRKEAPLFDEIRDDRGQVPLRDLRAFTFQTLRVPTDASVLAGIEDGRPLLAERRVGDGSVFASGLAFDAAGCNLPLKAGFLAVAQGMALGARGRAGSNLALTAGDRLPDLLPGDGPVRIRSLAAPLSLDWTGPAGGLPVLPRAGIYTLEAGTSRIYAAVSAAAGEALETYLDAPGLPAAAGLPHTVRTYAGAGGLAAELKRARGGVDFYTPLLLACLLAALGEGWLGSLPPRGTGKSGRARPPAHRLPPDGTSSPPGAAP